MSIISAPVPAVKADRPALPRVRWVGHVPTPEDRESYEAWLDTLDADNRMELQAALGDPEAGDPANWPAWTDEEVVSLPELTLDGWIEAEADRFASLDTEAADLIAESLRVLAALVRMTKAETPGQYRDRISAYDTI